MNQDCLFDTDKAFAAAAAPTEMCRRSGGCRELPQSWPRRSGGSRERYLANALYFSQRGFSLVSAIFLLVVIAALGTFAVTLSTTQHQGTALDVMGVRAYQAARAGIEWGAYQVLQNGGACAAITPLPALPGTLSDFGVTVTCTSTPHSEAADTVTVYELTSNAKQGTPATANYIERQISVTIAK